SEAAELLLNRQEGPRVGDGGVDLLAVADDAGVTHEARHVARTESGHALWIEVGECRAEGGPLPENRVPRQARLHALEHDELEEAALLAQRHAPFRIVVGGG